MKYLALLGLAVCCASPALAQDQIPKQSTALEIVDVPNRFEYQKSNTADQPICSLSTQKKNERDFVHKLWTDYASVFGFRDWNNFGPDSSYRQIRIVSSGKAIVLKSWHPSAERNGKAVATSKGIEALNGRTLDQALSGDPGYLSKRNAFDALVAKCLERQPSR